MNYRDKEKQQYERAFERYGTQSHKGGGVVREEAGMLVTLPWDRLPGPPIPEHGDTWGRWRLNMDCGYASLDYGSYWIRVDDVVKSELHLLHWIEHLHGKLWGRDPVNMGNFIDAALTIRRYGYLLKDKHVKPHE